ncbi:MAG TPA: cyclase family protein [Candidatus Obscuribacterales bacterium]
MTKLIDLTRPLGNVDKSTFPQKLLPVLRIIAPRIHHIDHQMGASVMQHLFNCKKEDLPEGEGWAEDDLAMSSHLGTHVDAPWHYGSKSEGKPARTIEKISLEELYCPAVVLDLTAKRATGAAITIEDLQTALDKVSYRIQPGDAVLIRTDHDKYALNDELRYNYPGMTRASTLWLAEQGAHIGGTDATGWDRPFHVMIENFQRTADKSCIWDAHFAGRDRELIIVQQLANLDKLPPHGFKVGFFPLLLEKCSAAPARVVAFVE